MNHNFALKNNVFFVCRNGQSIWLPTPLGSTGNFIFKRLKIDWCLATVATTSMERTSTCRLEARPRSRHRDQLIAGNRYFARDLSYCLCAKVNSWCWKFCKILLVLFVFECSLRSMDGKRRFARHGLHNIVCVRRYSEIKYYNFGNPGFSQGTGHFTQVQAIHILMN